MLTNEMALIAVIAICIISKRSLLPCMIASFYIMYMSIDDYAVTNDISDRSWYLINAIMDICVLMLGYAALASGNAYIKTTFLYMIYVMMFYLVPDLTLFLSAGSMFEGWAVLLYDSVMFFAIPIDITFALVGSDNAISRRIYRS